MPTARQLAAERKRVRRDLERDARERDRKRLAQLRDNLAHARKLKRERLAEVVSACRLARKRLTAQRKALRARYFHDLAAERERNRLASRNACEGRKNKIRAQGISRVERAERALAEERAHQRKLRIIGRKKPLKPSHAAPRARRSAESIQESDSEVYNNLPPDLHAVFRAVRSKIKGSARTSRTERFLEWVQEHQGQVRKILDKQYDREVAELEKHEKELRKRVMSPKHYRGLRDSQLSEVPF